MTSGKLVVGIGLGAEVSCLHEAVKALGVSGVGDAQSGHGGACCEAGHLFVERHERKDVADAMFQRHSGIQEGILRLGKRQLGEENDCGTCQDTRPLHPNFHNDSRAAVAEEPAP